MEGRELEVWRETAPLPPPDDVREREEEVRRRRRVEGDHELALPAASRKKTDVNSHRKPSVFWPISLFVSVSHLDYI